MLKLGIAAAWFTALVSAEMSAPEAAGDADADAELLVAGAELGGELELGLLDDEHAASSIAAPIAVTPKATRDARGV